MEAYKFKLRSLFLEAENTLLQFRKTDLGTDLYRKFFRSIFSSVFTDIFNQFLTCCRLTVVNRFILVNRNSSISGPDGATGLNT